MDAYFYLSDPTSDQATAPYDLAVIGYPVQSEERHVQVDTIAIPQRSSDEWNVGQVNQSQRHISAETVDIPLVEDAEVARILKKPKTRPIRKESGRSNPVGHILRYFSSATRDIVPSSTAQQEKNTPPQKKAACGKIKKTRKQASVGPKQKYTRL